MATLGELLDAPKSDEQIEKEARLEKLMKSGIPFKYGNVIVKGEKV